MTVRSGSVAVKIYRVRQPKARLGYVFSLAYSSPEGRKVRQFAALEEAKQEAQLAADRIATGHAEASNISRSDGEELIAARRLTGEVPLLSALQECVKGQLSGCARSIILVRSEGGRLGGGRLRDVHQAPGEPQPLTQRVAGVREGAL